MNLFAYGTLMWPEVLEAVIGYHRTGKPASLKGYLRLRVRGEHYPAVIRSSGSVVEGCLYQGLTAGDFDRLDRFEGNEYTRESVAVGSVEAEIYILSEAWRHIAEPLPWNPEDVLPEHLKAFCSEYKGWQLAVPSPAGKQQHGRP